MGKYDFETKQLYPFVSWEVGCGSLWYIKERDGLFLLDNEETRPKSDKSNRPYHEYQLAKGLPAALLSQGFVLSHPNFNAFECYRDYFKATDELFSDRPAFYVPLIMEDWEYTLRQLIPVEHDFSKGFVDKHARMKVATILRELFNPFSVKNIEDKINFNYYYSCNLKDRKEPQEIFSHMPNVKERLAAPVILVCGLNEPKNLSRLQVDGFMAAVINLALCYDWEKRWQRFNFASLEVVKHINKTYREHAQMIELDDIHNLSFTLPIEVTNLCKVYMDVFLPIMREVWKYKPEVQLACVEGDNIYTYMYACEQYSIEKFVDSELYKNFDVSQQKTIYSYAVRFCEWLVKNYPITIASQKRIMDAIGRELPPIEVTITNNVKVTRAGDDLAWEEQGESYISRSKRIPGKPAREEVFKQSKSRTIKRGAKFVYIISEDRKEINKIHKRIELHLASPAKLRDELVRLQEDELVSLPMENPTAIIRAIRDVWGEATPKERSFVTTWGRRV